MSGKSLEVDGRQQHGAVFTVVACLKKNDSCDVKNDIAA